jgi:hypothetical protein
MGDRGNIVFRAPESIYLYTHWEGSRLPELCIEAVLAAKPRWGDQAYATRIALTTLIGKVEGEHGWGVSTEVQDNEHYILEVDWINRRVNVTDEMEGLLDSVSFDRLNDLRSVWR